MTFEMLRGLGCRRHLGSSDYGRCMGSPTDLGALSASASPGRLARRKCTSLVHTPTKPACSCL